ncbi:Smr/MutS family protein [Thermodesulfobacteriota bacterium]
MKPSKPRSTFRHFKDLKTLLDSRSFPISQCLTEHPPIQRKDKPEPEDEQRLFQEAMADVTPISKNIHIEKNIDIDSPRGPEDESEADALLRLKNLVEYGEGFVVADTPEYIEGGGYEVSPELTRRLHRGDYSIQAYIDLHGLSVEYAHEAFEKFIKESITTGKRAVLVVHGRGLSSPDKPVLKTKLVEWITRSPWRKWVIAFSSARACDGGAGATYLLLRERPLTKRFRKRKKDA